jgi:DNA-3-methyladenine glycosylase
VWLTAPLCLAGSVDYAWLDLPATKIDEAARLMLGWRLSANGVVARLTEVEAYSGLGEDPASHAHRGKTPRNAIMFGPAGFLYVYQIYGMYQCMNIVCGEEGVAAAVLLRAAEVVEGVETARERRPGAKHDRDLGAGPGKLTRALGISKADYGTSVVDGTGPLTITPPLQGDVPVIEAGPRVGVTSAHDVAWRFWIKDDPTVSPYRRHTPKRRRRA